MQDLKKIETTDAPLAIGPYSQAIYAAPFLFVSGQLPIEPRTGKLTASNIQIQTVYVLNNVEAILTAAGSNWHQVVKCEIFLQDIHDFATVNLEYAKKINPLCPPARQTIQVARLPLDALIEISCIAYLPLT